MKSASRQGQHCGIACKATAYNTDAGISFGWVLVQVQAALLAIQLLNTWTPTTHVRELWCLLVSGCSQYRLAIITISGNKLMQQRHSVSLVLILSLFRSFTLLLSVTLPFKEVKKEKGKNALTCLHFSVPHKHVTLKVTGQTEMKHS